MAIYHLHAQMISRSKGRSAVACAAYRAAEKYLDVRLDKQMDFSRKKGVEYKEILAPDSAPSWAKEREKLWNNVEAKERRKNSQVAREVRVALPNELSNNAQERLVREYAQEQFVSQGMVADICIHRDDSNNQHAHIMLTTREISEDGFTRKNRDWNNKDLMLIWRAEWSRKANIELAREGHEQRIDHRSYAEVGIDLEPQKKLGISPKLIEKDVRDVIQERFEEHKEIARRNGEAIKENPEIALDAIIHQRATFTQTDVGRWLHTKTADAEQFQACLSKVMASPEIVNIGQDDHGKERFTTKEMLYLEKEMLLNTNELSRSHNHRVSARHIDKAEASKALTEEQQKAYRHLVERSGDIAVIEGYAGAGKSYMLGAAREAWEASGYRVKGAALAGKAAEGLEQSSGIESRSIHSWEYAWKNNNDLLSHKDVFVIDEAAMVGSRQLGRVISHVKESGAKVVLVHDTEQLQAIEAGAPSRRIGQEVGQETMSEIRRQSQEWQREATRNFGQTKTKEALDAYDRRGHIHEHQTKQDALDKVVKSWDRHRQAYPEQTQIILAYTRADVKTINEQARKIRIEAEELGQEHQVKTERGERLFADGDRVYFLKNDRGLDVKNGSLGTIKSITGPVIGIELDDSKRQVMVDIRQYNNLDHGYAATAHKSQGATVDRAHVLASDYFDRHVAYVSMSRHRNQVDLHWSKEEFENRKALDRTLCTERRKDMAIDYADVMTVNRELAGWIEDKMEQEKEKVKEIPREKDKNTEEEKLISTYKQLEKDSKKKRITEKEHHKQQPEISRASYDLDQARIEYETQSLRRKALENKHPFQAMLNTGDVAAIRKKEKEAKVSYEKAKETYARTWNDPEIQARTRKEVKEHNTSIGRAREQLKDLKPDYDQALEIHDKRLYLERQQEILNRRVKDRDPAIEFKTKLEGLRKQYGKNFDPRRADWSTCRELAKEGFSKDQLQGAIREVGEHSKGQKYVDRTVNKVFELEDVKSSRKELEQSITKEQSKGLSLFKGFGL